MTLQDMYEPATLRCGKFMDLNTQRLTLLIFPVKKNPKEILRLLVEQILPDYSIGSQGAMSCVWFSFTLFVFVSVENFQGLDFQ